jgi:hypothetical protein
MPETNENRDRLVRVTFALARLKSAIDLLGESGDDMRYLRDKLALDQPRAIASLEDALLAAHRAQAQLALVVRRIP